MNNQDHLLVLLIEECAEVQQRASKALRFGLSEVQRGQELTNGERLRGEVDDLLAVLQLIQMAEMIPPHRGDHIEKKIEKIRQFLDYSIKLGRVSSDR